MDTLIIPQRSINGMEISLFSVPPGRVAQAWSNMPLCYLTVVTTLRYYTEGRD